MIYVVSVNVEVEAKTPEEAEDQVMDHLSTLGGAFITVEGVELLTNV